MNNLLFSLQESDGEKSDQDLVVDDEHHVSAAIWWMGKM